MSSNNAYIFLTKLQEHLCKQVAALYVIITHVSVSTSLLW